MRKSPEIRQIKISLAWWKNDKKDTRKTVAASSQEIMRWRRANFNVGRGRKRRRCSRIAKYTVIHQV
jgi:hypothetical protein